MNQNCISKVTNSVIQTLDYSPLGQVTALANKEVSSYPLKCGGFCVRKLDMKTKNKRKKVIISKFF